MNRTPINKIKESKSVLFLVVLIFSAGLVLFGLNKFIGHYRYLLFFSCYLALTIGFYFLSKKFLYKPIKVIEQIIRFPLAFVFILLSIIYPVILTFQCISYFFLIPLIVPTIVLMVLKFLFSISPALQLFIIFSGFSLLSIIFFDSILKLTYFISRVKTSEKLKHYEIENIVEHILNRKSIKFLIYSSYFIYIIVYSVYALDGRELFDDKYINMAVMQSFVTVLAFDSLVINSFKIKFLPSLLLGKFMGSIQKEISRIKETPSDK